MSVAENLKEIGDWTSSKQLVKISANTMKISERNIYEKLKNEVAAKR